MHPYSLRFGCDLVPVFIGVPMLRFQELQCVERHLEDLVISEQCVHRLLKLVRFLSLHLLSRNFLIH